MAWNGSDQGNIVRDYDSLTLRYPGGQGFNAETLLSDPLTGDLYVLTKEPQISHVYRAAASQLSTGQTVTMELVGQLDFPVASGGDISPTGTEIVIRNERLAWLFVRGEGQSVADALAGTPMETGLYEIKPQAVGSQLAAAVDWLFAQDQRASSPRAYVA